MAWQGAAGPGKARPGEARELMLISANPLARWLQRLEATARPFVLARSWCAPELGFVCWVGAPGERGRVPNGRPFFGRTLVHSVARAARWAERSSG